MWDYVMPVDSPDLNAYLCVQMGSLAEIAEVLVIDFEARKRLLNHLTNPDEFWGEYALPSLAFNDANFDPQTMWRGPVWVNINCLLSKP